MLRARVPRWLRRSAGSGRCSTTSRQPKAIIPKTVNSSKPQTSARQGAGRSAAVAFRKMLPCSMIALLYQQNRDSPLRSDTRAAYNVRMNVDPSRSEPCFETMLLCGNELTIWTYTIQTVNVKLPVLLLRKQSNSN